MSSQTQNPFQIHKGRLHKALGIPEGQKIPAGRLREVLHSKDPHMRKMANFAQNAKKFHHKKQKNGSSKYRHTKQ